LIKSRKRIKKLEKVFAELKLSFIFALLLKNPGTKLG
jgi:hypothetical protein